MRKEKTLRIKGEVYPLQPRRVMGILNSTPDSFFSGSRNEDASSLRRRIREMKAVGVDMVDVGGYSTRPGAPEVTVAEEWRRVSVALEVLREEWEDAIISVDTFRAEIARRSVEQFGVSIINDISGGDLDKDMWSCVAEAGVAYVLMHTRGTPADMQTLTDYDDVVAEVFEDLMRKASGLHQMGVADVILDPGFGFAKTVEQNYQLLASLEMFADTGMAVLAGMSRKSMIWRPLGITPEDSLAGTIALHTASLLKGADIVRVHDVAEALQMRNVVEMLLAQDNKK